MRAKDLNNIFLDRTYKWSTGKQYLLDPSPRVMEMKTKINKWDLMKLQSFCCAKALKFH